MSLNRIYFSPKQSISRTENLSPSELKKLKNKQRKKAKQEAQRKERQRQEEAKKEAANKVKPADAEMDGPKEEELVPDKLAKVRSVALQGGQKAS